MATPSVLLPGNSAHSLKLTKMVDLAIGTPEVGAVNFNMLHTLLHALINKLQLEDAEEVVEDVRLSARDDKDSLFTQDSGVSSEQTSSKLHTPYHQLQDRVDILERQISVLNNVPSGKDLVDTYFGQREDSNKPGVTEAIQSLQLKKRVDSNEEGVNRLGSVVDELMKRIRNLEHQNEQLTAQLKDVSQMSDIWSKLSQLELDIKNMDGLLNELKLHLGQYPSPDAFSNFVTWESLEKALKGIKDQMANLQKPTERIVVNMATDPMSRPQSASSSQGPSEALQEMLENLGNLTNRHDKLEERVVVLEEEMPNKADKKDLDNLKIPDDLLQKIHDMKSQLDNLLTLRNRDNDAMSRIREAMNKLQNDMDKLNAIVKQLAEDSSSSLKRIEELMSITNDHEDRKADISYVDMKVEPKADLTTVNGKVSTSLFDETTGNLHKLIEDLLRKLLGSEEDLRKLLESLTENLDNKLDRSELDPLKEWLEKRLKALAAKIKGRTDRELTEDEAAGLRKQLLQHFHCISCDRPLEVAPAHPYPSIPERPGLPAMRSMRPYTTFDLENFRHPHKGTHSEVIDAYQTARACGGSHTMYHGGKRNARGISAAYIEEEPVQAPRYFKEELDLEGVDGHIYKGRLDYYSTPPNEDSGKFPPVPSAGGRAPAPVSIDRPKSGRATPRSSSAKPQITAKMEFSTPRPESRQEVIAAPSPTFESPMQTGEDLDSQVEAAVVN